MKSKFIFLHGGPGFRDYLEPYFRQIAEDFDCVFYDQSRGPDVTVEDLLRELEIKVGDSMPILIGHSRGGVLAAEFASRFERKISGLVLMSSGLSHRQWHEYRRDLEKLGLADAPMGKIVLVANDPHSSDDFLTKMGATFSEETFDSLHEAYLKQFDLTEAVQRMALRIIYISGDQDLRFSSKIADEIESLNAQIKGHRLVGVGHFPFLQQNAKKQIHDILRLEFANR